MRVARHGAVVGTIIAGCLVAPAGAAWAQESPCAILCTPDLKFEPTVTFENLGNRARVDVGGVVEETAGETILELIFAVGIPTTIPRVGFTLEAIFAPFKGTDEHPFTG